MSEPRYIQQGIGKATELLQSLDEIDPSLRTHGEEFSFDITRAFQLYAQFGGDVVRTGHAMGVQPAEILRTAERLGWNKQLEQILELQKSSKPGDVERGISRAMNFVQAHRMRLVLERILDKLYSMSPEELFERTQTVTIKKSKDGGEVETHAINTKPFADLAAALEKVHQMCYQALGDTVTERTKRQETREDSVSATQLHSIIASAMAGNPRSAPAAQALSPAESDEP